MSRFEMLSRPGWRGATVGDERVPHRVFFTFNRARVHARTHLTEQPLRASLTKEKTQQIKAGDLSSLAGLIGKRLAEAASEADQVKVTIARQKARSFNFYSGEDKAGKKVVLIELI